MARHFVTAMFIALALLAALLLYGWATDFFLIDNCLDVGGRWNADTRMCEIEAGQAPKS